MQPNANNLLNIAGITTPLVGFYDTPDIKPFEPFAKPKHCIFSCYDNWTKFGWCCRNGDIQIFYSCNISMMSIIMSPLLQHYQNLKVFLFPKKIWWYCRNGDNFLFYIRNINRLNIVISPLLQHYRKFQLYGCRLLALRCRIFAT